MDYLMIPREDFEKNAKVDVSRWIRKKTGLDYIPWAIALGLLRSYNPSLYVGFETDTDGKPYFKTDSGVYLLAYLFDKETGKRSPSLFHAVRGYNNKAEVNPTIDTIQNQMQRAFAKVIALETGLGWNLYARIDESIDLADDTEVSMHASAPASPRAKAKQHRTDDVLDF